MGHMSNRPDIQGSLPTDNLLRVGREVWDILVELRLELALVVESLHLFFG